jgi:Tfp pilus assembly protein PilO
MVSLQTQIKWSVRAQWALAMAIVLLLGAFYLLAFRPQRAHLRAVNQKIEQCQKDLLANQSQTSILPKVRAEVDVLRARLMRFKALPRQQELAQFIMDIAQLGTQASLKQFDWKPRDPLRAERCIAQPLLITFEGDFISVFSFLRHAEDLQRLARVTQMNLKSKDKHGQVKAQLTMNIYYASGE